MGPMLLSVENVRKKYPVGHGFLGKPTAFVQAVRGITFEIMPEEIVGVVGESGCGKSTLGRCVVGLESPDAGRVVWEGMDTQAMSTDVLRKKRKLFQMVFQNPFASLDPRQRIKDLLSEPLEVHGLSSAAERQQAVKGLLEDVGLPIDSLRKFPHEFSGGQRQRIGLARALAVEPKLIVLDEPVSSLDVSIQASILNLLVRLNQQKGISYLFISHDLQVVGYLSNRILVLYLGQVVESGPTERLIREPIHPYTEVLLDTMEANKGGVKGEPPSPVDIPTGCSFHTRCPYAENRCQKEPQDLVMVDKDRAVACWKWDRIKGKG